MESLRKVQKDVYKKLYSYTKYTNSKVWYQNNALNLNRRNRGMEQREPYFPYPYSIVRVLMESV